MPAMWDDMPRVQVVPVRTDYTLHYEIRLPSGTTVQRHHNEKDAADWCKERGFDYTVTRSEHLVDK